MRMKSEQTVLKSFSLGFFTIVDDSERVESLTGVHMLRYIITDSFTLTCEKLNYDNECDDCNKPKIESNNWIEEEQARNEHGQM